jgi:MFS family permease
MFLTLVIEIQWLSHAAVARPAEVFYEGQFDRHSFFNIDFLALVYMLVFLIMSFPASYVIDTFGIKKGLTIGAIFTGVFSLVKATWGMHFIGILIGQCGLAIAQPFILNAVTAVTVRWFPLKERALAAGLSALAQYIGIVVAMVVSPLLIVSNPEMANYGDGFSKMLWIYGGVSALAAFLLIVFIQEQPHDNGEVMADGRFSFKEGVHAILKNRDMLITLVLFLIGLGIFNAISSMTDAIAEYAGVKDSDGLIGGLMLIGGIVGAVILPLLSDKFEKRKLFLVICMIGMIPGVFGLAFAGWMVQTPGMIYQIQLLASFILGFFVMSAGPIGFQYAAEVSYPAPESASQGMLLWIGQISGMVFVAGMSIQSNQFLGEFLVLFSALSVLSLIGVLFLRESPMIGKTNQ